MDRERATAALAELLDTVLILRGPGGCEWDRSQTVASLRPFLLEEAYEVAEAAEEGDWDALRSELGDLLLHILLDAVIADEEGRFDLAQVADGIRAKLVRRHPHVFGAVDALSPGEVERQWERIKSGEKGRGGFFDSIPAAMPALQTAWRIQQRAADLGYEGREGDATPGLREIVANADADAGTDGIGRLLFEVVDYARIRGHEPEAALRKACRSFMDGLEGWRG